MKNILEELKKISEKRIFWMIENKYHILKGNQTYFDFMMGEIKEVENEIKENNSVYLEDELGDVLWTYLCFLYSLKQEGKIISVEKVFERALKKYSERINSETGGTNGIWEEIKEKQKIELKIENEQKYGK